MTGTMGEALKRTVDCFPDRIFLRDGDRQLTFRETSARVDAIGRALLAMGLKRHDRLALWMPNSPEWALFALACGSLGILLVPLNTRSKAEETAYILRKSKVKALVMVDRFWTIDYCELLAEAIPGFSRSNSGVRNRDALPHLDSILLFDGGVDDFGVERWAAGSGVDGPSLEKAKAAVKADDPFLTVFTSGTTGYPKGAVHTHVILRNVENIARGMHIESGDVVMGHMPFFHVAGLCTALLPAVINGCTLVTMAQWDPVEAARTIAGLRANIFGGIPTHFIDLAEAVEREGLDTSCLKGAWIGGATVSPEIARHAKDVLRVQALQAAYGMTETSACTTLSRFEDPLEIACEGKGVPIGDFEVRVADPETGAERQAGENGEIWVRGHIVMKEYLEDPAETARAMTPDGWFRTGDLGHFDADGYLKLTGRLKDMFIVGGSNVYPAEVERCLDAMPGVRQAVVVGVPDKRLGEVGFAFVELDGSAGLSDGDVLAFAKRSLADYKVPRHIRFVEDFPMTGARKIQRHVLVSKAIALLGALQNG
ncbi:MAG: AMP-binding protein [Sphingobium sp.]